MTINQFVSFISLLLITNQGVSQNTAEFHHFIASDETGTKEVYISSNGNSCNAVYTDFFEGNGVTYFLNGHLENELVRCEILACVAEDQEGKAILVKDSKSILFSFNADKTQLTIDETNTANVNILTDCEYSLDYLVPIWNTASLLELCDPGAKPVLSYDFSKQFDLPINSRPRIIEIGSFQNQAKSVGFWYKVKVDEKTGWIFIGKEIS